MLTQVRIDSGQFFLTKFMLILYSSQTVRTFLHCGSELPGPELHVRPEQYTPMPLRTCVRLVRIGLSVLLVFPWWLISTETCAVTSWTGRMDAFFSAFMELIQTVTGKSEPPHPHPDSLLRGNAGLLPPASLSLGLRLPWCLCVAHATNPVAAVARVRCMWLWINFIPLKVIWLFENDGVGGGIGETTYSGCCL